MSYTKHNFVSGDTLLASDLNSMEDQIAENEQTGLDLKSALTSGTQADAIYHLGFYLDANGDLCQVESN